MVFEQTAKLQPSEVDQAGLLELQIGIALAHAMGNGQSLTVYRVEKGTPQRVTEHVAELYRMYGWIVHHEPDPVNGGILRIEDRC